MHTHPPTHTHTHRAHAPATHPRSLAAAKGPYDGDGATPESIAAENRALIGMNLEVAMDMYYYSPTWMEKKAGMFTAQAAVKNSR